MGNATTTGMILKGFLGYFNGLPVTSAVRVQGVTLLAKQLVDEVPTASNSRFEEIVNDVASDIHYDHSNKKFGTEGTYEILHAIETEWSHRKTAGLRCSSRTQNNIHFLADYSNPHRDAPVLTSYCRSDQEIKQQEPIVYFS